MGDNGWIKVHRKITDSEIWSLTDAQFRIAMYLLMEARHDSGWFRLKRLNSGQIHRSIRTIAADCRRSTRTIQTALSELSSCGFIRRELWKNVTLITICKYDLYQNTVVPTVADSATPGTTLGTTLGTTKQEGKKGRTKETPPQAPQGGRFVKPTSQDIQTYCSEKKFRHVDPDAFIDYYESNGWKVGRANMKSWRSAVSGWNRRNKNGAKQPEQTDIFGTREDKEAAGRQLLKEYKEKEEKVAAERAKNHRP